MGRKIAKILKVSVVAILVAGLLLATGVAVYSGVNTQIFKVRMSYVNYIDSIFDEQIDNVILMIGDGMGANHIEVAKAYSGKENLIMETLAVNGEVSTFSKNGTTDSAAAATAMSTGVKIYNGGIAMDDGEDLQTLSEYAMAHGKSVGIICTEDLVGATPAGFSAHATSRSNYGAIAETQLESGIDLFMGGGKELYELFNVEKYGYDYVNNMSDLDPAADKIFAAFTKVPATGGSDETPLLKDLVSFAIDYLEDKSDDGYFLMIEGSHIDKKSHANEIEPMIAELLAFDDAVATVADMMSDKTFLMVTADHETGDLLYKAGDDINNSLFHSGGHTNKNVRYFATPQIDNLPDKIDNTNIAYVFRQLISSDR